jgi:hypothetical protein
LRFSIFDLTVSLGDLGAKQCESVLIRVNSWLKAVEKTKPILLLLRMSYIVCRVLKNKANWCLVSRTSYCVLRDLKKQTQFWGVRM